MKMIGSDRERGEGVGMCKYVCGVYVLQVLGRRDYNSILLQEFCAVFHLLLLLLTEQRKLAYTLSHPNFKNKLAVLNDKNRKTYT